MIGTNDPAAWTRASFASPDDYIVPLSPSERRIIADAVQRMRDRGRLDVPVET